MRKIDLVELSKTLNIAKNRIVNHSDIFGDLYCSNVLDPAVKFISKLINSDNVRFHYLDINPLEIEKLKNFKDKSIFSYESKAVEDVLYLYNLNKRLGSTSKYWMVKSKKLELLTKYGRSI